MPVRITGPYRHRGKVRFRVSTGPGTHAWTPARASESEARQLAEDLADAAQARLDLTVGALVERYLEHLRIDGRKLATLEGTRNKLRLILGPRWDAEAAQITERSARELYAELVPTRAAATHHEALGQARSCWAWAVQEGAVKSNPWTAVRKVGKAKRGKEQLTIDEARTFMAYCESRMMFDDGALVGLLALLCGLRESEIVALTVRSVDDNGRKLRISTTKTEAGKRDPEIPENLKPAIDARMLNRPPDAPLIPHVARVPGSARTWVYREIKKLCRGAGVPVVCPHALRGGLATLAYEAGALPHLIAQLLGHTSSKMTERHYATPAAVEGAKMKRHLGVLQGGKPA